MLNYNIFNSSSKFDEVARQTSAIKWVDFFII